VAALTPARTLTPAQAADQLGVAAARIRALLASGALQPATDGLVAAADVAELSRRGTLRSLDVAAVEGAVDRALRRRLPTLLGDGLDAALQPLAGEVATALADVEISTQQLVEEQERTRTAEAALAQARARVVELEQRVAALTTRPAGLFRRRRAVEAAPA